MINSILRHVLFLPEQGSTFSIRSDHLHYVIILTTMGVATVIGVTVLVFIVRYRQRTRGALTPHITGSTLTESIYVGVPLAFFLGCFFAGFHDFIWEQSPPSDAMDVYVMAKQWMWQFSYPEGPSAIGALRVPVGRPVRLLITSRDVVHSFYVPAFRAKQDAVPGRYTQMWFQVQKPGHYQVLCAEYCGLQHSNMRAEVVGLEPADFEAWVQQQRRGVARKQDAAGPLPTPQPSSADLRAQGQRLAVEQGCLKCHSVDGTPHIGPTWLDLYGRVETLQTGEKVRADEAYLTESMMDPLARVVAGFNPVMPSFQGQLDAAETAALVEYIKSLRSQRLENTSSEEPVYVPFQP